MDSTPSLTFLPLFECPERIPLLAEWQFRQWGAHNPGETLERRQAMLQAHRGPPGLPATWVALHEGALAGSAALVGNDMDTRPDDRPWLASVYVRENQRGKGIGRCLVRHVESEARRMGFSTLFLYTPDRAGWYAGLGWETVASCLYRGFNVSVMKRRLFPPS